MLLTPSNAKFTPSVLQKPSSCMNGQKNNLQRDTSNHPNPHMPPVHSISKRRMVPINRYKTIGRLITGRSRTNIHSQISNTLQRNFRDIPYSPNLISDPDTIMSVYTKGMNERLPSELQKDTGNPRSCTLDNVTCRLPSNKSSTNSYSP